ncbi:MAG: hypothetical protein A2087_05670 [Spirochaetes bacterium GWD1_61_31]|nr:MAG: hypothetical protein A2Y37_03520 [Spirochaetes bacterium GWB1_60_80]OHD35124.1 MAG: hypothetical protein A2004_05415 [Spirochaetes bacterium GWC1_61_12]OHD43643.1 MAG: hypothetical protein A2087_05670 [Spirochaetes bacterium GWD1_61_31]OHD44134.1 MAG: hypothetical protein A2Y35_02095 [Spirochaetes bacterium GWE1_60_18]OHD61824.1 MAG: hypothetical protein A2Y32_13780 [Spirochaetes bacterium GWF1_60_12]HAW85112.1 hypothetical protein [Spirochaetaceae bacterium]
MPNPEDRPRSPPAAADQCYPAGSFLQSDFWAAFKQRPGVQSLAAELTIPGSNQPLRLSVLVHRLPAGLSLAYIPHGPDCVEPVDDPSSWLCAVGRQLRPLLPGACLAIRFDPAWFRAEITPPVDAASVQRLVLSAPLRKAADVQPPDTVVLDLSPGEDQLLAAMKPKWRYNIKLAEKKGVAAAVESGTAAADQTAIATFYDLYQATAKRDRIALHAKAYYLKLLATASHGAAAPLDTAIVPDVRVWVARHDGQALASIVTLFYGRQAVYLYGASSDFKRNLMPAYLLQWAAIKAAKLAGCSEYDFYGIPPVEDPTHPMAGLYRFKTGFGGQVRHYAGAWDLPLRPFWYGLYRMAEALRLFWYKTVKKRLG